MPYRDGTGPRGMGPMTGRGAGFCAGYVPPNAGMGGMGLGRGCGRGFGMGNGWRRGWAFREAQVQPASYFHAAELSTLKDQARYFGEALTSINKRISEIETEQSTK